MESYADRQARIARTRHTRFTPNDDFYRDLKLPHGITTERAKSVTAHVDDTPALEDDLIRRIRQRQA